MMVLRRVLLTILFICCPLTVLAQVMDLEIINIKPAGTGSPAILSTNRIFRAYPGIEYNIRAAVVGGEYPYVYALSNAPAGMTINSATGEISWPNPQSNAGQITLVVTDQENTTVSTSWSITVATDGFIFIDASYSGTETGSLSQPYSSIANMLSGTFQGDDTRIVYFRGGNYTLPDWNSTADATNLSDNPGTWLGYPDETVNIDADDLFIVSTSAYAYFDNLNFSNFLNYGLMTNSSQHYVTVRRCGWSDINGNSSANENQGFIYISNADVAGYYLVIQDNEFSGNVGAQAIGSLYNRTKTLIENNYIHDGGYSGQHGFCTPIGIKAINTYYTIRGNKIILPASATDFEIYNELTSQDTAEFNFNYIAKESGGNDQALSFYYPTYFYLNRNTFVGDIAFDPGNSSGPYSFTNNVLVGSLLDDDYVTSSGNLTGVSTDNIVDTDGLLTASYSSYEGTAGWQLDDGSTPIDGTFIPSTTTCYKDADDDGYSDGTTTTTEGICPTNYYISSELTATSGDCDDTDASFNPGATQVCGNGLDEQTCDVIDDTCPTVSGGTVFTSGTEALVAPETGYILIMGD